MKRPVLVEVDAVIDLVLLALVLMVWVFVLAPVLVPVVVLVLLKVDVIIVELVEVLVTEIEEEVGVHLGSTLRNPDWCSPVDTSTWASMYSECFEAA